MLFLCLCQQYSEKEDKYEEEIKVLTDKLKEVRSWLSWSHSKRECFTKFISSNQFTPYILSILFLKWNKEAILFRSNGREGITVGSRSTTHNVILLSLGRIRIRLSTYILLFSVLTTHLRGYFCYQSACAEILNVKHVIFMINLQHTVEKFFWSDGIPVLSVEFTASPCLFFCQAETRAEFAERTVAKLEKSIDDLEGMKSVQLMCHNVLSLSNRIGIYFNTGLQAKARE